MDGQETNFLIQKERKERTNYFKVFRILMLVSFVMPFIGAWYRAYDGAPNAFSFSRFFVSCGLLLSISFLSTYLAYRYNLRLLQKDIKFGTKTIEVVKISKRLNVSQNDTYHFYIDSSVRLSIEVSSAYYNQLLVGDELCIEYSTYAKEYLGYF